MRCTNFIAAIRGKVGKIISREICNTGRQPELDITRGLAVGFMVLVHVQILFAHPTAPDTLFGALVDFLGGIPAAPVFMFLLGVGINYTRKSEPRLFIKRGLGLLLTGYVLNLVRATVPYWVKWWLTRGEGYLALAAEGLIYVDILQFAGLALILFGGLKALRRPYWGAVGIGWLSILLNFVALRVRATSYVSAALTGLLWGSHAGSYFPFLTWICYPLAGYLFGALLMRCVDKKRFYLIALGVSGLVVAVLSALALGTGLDVGLASDESYYHHTLPGNLFFTAFVVSWLSVWYFLTPRLPARLTQVLLRWSANVTPIYFIHWVLIGIGLLCVDFNSLGIAAYLGMFLLVMLSSDGLALAYQRRKHGHNP